MKLEDYQLLLDLNEYGTLRSTAKKVLISQPALTQRLKYIEEQLGGLIFLRTPKKLVSTPFGEIVLDHAATVISREQELRERLVRSKGKVAGTLSIGASTLFSQYFLPEMLQSFTEKFPEVTVDLITGTSEEIRRSCFSFHVSIVRGDAVRDYEALHLLNDSLYLFDTVPFHPDRERPFIEFKSDAGFQRLLERWMVKQKDFLFKRSFKVDQFETAKQMMKRGLGMTVLPESIIKDEKSHYDHKLLSVDGETVVRETWACIKPGTSELPQVGAFMNHMKENLQEDKK